MAEAVGGALTERSGAFRNVIRNAGNLRKIRCCRQIRRPRERNSLVAAVHPNQSPCEFEKEL